MYVRPSGQYGTHSWQVHCVAVGCIFYIAVQVFDQFHDRHLCALHGLSGRLGVASFALLLSNGILHVLNNCVTVLAGGLNLDLHKANMLTFQSMQAQIINLLKGLQKVSKKGEEASDDDE
jgi:hypothetical protein